MRTIVYIDGFNLYYRMQKRLPSLKWVNPLLMAAAVLDPMHQITRVNYYIARISARAHDPQAPARQATYLRALATVPEIAVQEAGKRVGLLVPVKYPTQSLMNVASFYLRLRPGHLAKSQFPATIVLPDGGSITKPATWV
jgi:hypothetical protein